MTLSWSDLEGHARSAMTSLASKHPMIGLTLAAIGVGTIIHVAAGKHATPAPAAQNQTTPAA